MGCTFYSKMDKKVVKLAISYGTIKITYTLLHFMTNKYINLSIILKFVVKQYLLNYVTIIKNIITI